MKQLLSLVLVLVLAPAFAADKNAPKAQAKTTASPTVDTKKAAPKAAPKAAAKAAPKKAPAKKVAEFEVYEAGPWKSVNNKKNHLLGYKITDADLFLQPVMVVKCDPTVELDGKKREENVDGRFVYNLIGWEAKETPRFQVVNVPSRELSSDDEALMAKNAGKSAGVPGFPWYKDFGLETEPANPKGEYPFYYVVGLDGKVHYAGPKGAKAQRVLWEELRRGGKADPMLGFYKPTVHTALASNLVFGASTLKAVQKLTPLAKSKTASDAKADAEAILKELEQTQTYYLKHVMLQKGANPPLALMTAVRAQKTFPKNKSYKALVDGIKNDPRVAPVIQTFMKVAVIQRKMQELADREAEPKKSDLKVWYPLVCNAEKKVNSAKKSLGDKLPRAFINLEDLVQTVKADLEAKGAGAR